MPAVRVAPPSLRRHKPSARGVVTLSGRDYYLGPWPDNAKQPPPETRAEYDRLVAEWLANGRRPPDASPAGVTVGEVIVAFWEHVERHYRRADGTPTSEVTEYRRALRPVRELYAHTFATDFRPLSLKAVRQRMVEAGLCRGVVNQRVGRVRRMFKWAAENELVPAGVFHGLQAVRGLQQGRSEARETEPVGPAPEADVEAVAAVVLRQVRDLIRLQLLTGMRPGEAVLVRPCDLDRSGPVWRYCPAHHKNAHHGHERVVYLGPKAQAVLTPYLARDPAAYLFDPREALAERDAVRRSLRRSKVQPSQVSRKKPRPKKCPGERYTTASYSRAVAAGCRKAVVPRWHPHQLRHNAATRLVAEHGWDAARIVLGHRTLQATRVYGEDNARKAAEVMAKVG